ncbi:hypothetical protein [Chondromyces apiculatus]|uniref:Zinc-finger domain-containing protein n=1 Tax=Chondromyces apiculatus DSM 436 TaxID=1192034 RepID=A0A017T4U6_9BACT|nr:hypothetical protein [Chondromyces apiculatus]EYF03845.1 Hypothetical protein CAP_5109 [Chondromyces apiculatus DSM 436]
MSSEEERCDRFDREGILLLEADQPLLEHCRSCVSCRAAHEKHLQIVNRLATCAEQIYPPADWMARIEGEIDKQESVDVDVSQWSGDAERYSRVTQGPMKRGVVTPKVARSSARHMLQILAASSFPVLCLGLLYAAVKMNEQGPGSIREPAAAVSTQEAPSAPSAFRNPGLVPAPSPQGEEPSPASPAAPEAVVSPRNRAADSRRNAKQAKSPSVKAPPSTAKDKKGTAAEKSTSIFDAGLDLLPHSSGSSEAEGSSPFNREAAQIALQSSAAQAAQCRKGSRRSGSGVAHVAFHTSGRVHSIELQMPNARHDAKRKACIESAFIRTLIVPFSGSSPTMAQPFTY